MGRGKPRIQAGEHARKAGASKLGQTAAQSQSAPNSNDLFMKFSQMTPEEEKQWRSGYNRWKTKQAGTKARWEKEQMRKKRGYMSS